MKKINIVLTVLLAVVFVACEYDNYDPPSINLSGKLVTSDGNNFLFDGSSKDVNLLKVIQKGFGKVDPGTVVKVDEKGNFNQLLFPGEYWLTLNNAVYPFQVKEFESLGAGLGYDSIYIDLKSNITKTFEVVPYYLISDFTAEVVGQNIVLKAKVNKNPDATGNIPNVAFARAYISTSSIVNSASTCTRSARAVISESGEATVTVPIFNDPASYRVVYKNNFRDYAFCRIALELKDVSKYYLFSETIKLEGVPLE